MANITKALVEREKAPQTGQKFIRDDGLRGFGLRVTAGGVKSFILEARIKGRVRRMTLGQYPDLSVLAARTQALADRTAIAHGEDPAEARKQQHRELTFGDLTAAWLERHAKAHRKTWERDKRRLEVHFVRWQTRRLSDVSREEVGREQHKIAQRHGQVASNRAMTLLRAVFNWGISEGIVTGRNPAIGLTFYHEQKRERFLSPDELQRVNEGLMAETDWRWRAYFPLLLLLGLRKNELLSARWVDVDLDQRTITIPDTKAGRSHLLPLPGPAIAMLEELPSRDKSEWLFPSFGKSGHIVEVKGAWTRIRDRAKVADVTVHDLRRTLGSWLAASGHSLPLIGKALNHSNVTSTQIYARLDLAPVRAALEANATIMRLGQ
ncbi:tyrosine-type recombinase/integrase [Candidatus Binatus sp.]|uniref:tyrosine-type recombinase/integrase n=1 Tax=Candidatus Binatus sp. TaxID=2811406 RepID=UPI003CC55528